MVEGIKIKQDVLRNMIELSQLKGINNSGKANNLFTQCLINLNKKTGMIEIKSLESEHNSVISFVSLKLDKGILGSGDIPIEIEKCLKSLSRFKGSDEISFTYKGKLYYKRAKPKYNLSKPTILVEDVETAITEDIPFKYNSKKNQWKSNNFILDNYMKLKASALSELIGDAQEVSNYCYTLNIEDKNIEFTIHDEETGDKAEREIEVIESKTNEVESSYSIGFGNILKNLHGEIEIWVASSAPMLIKQQLGDIKVIYIVSSYIEQTEGDDQTEQGSEQTTTQDAMDDQLEESLESYEDPEEEDEEEYQGEPPNEDDYTDADQCGTCLEEKANINDETGNCYECDLQIYNGEIVIEDGVVEEEEPEEEPEPEPPKKKKSSKAKKKKTTKKKKKK